MLYDGQSKDHSRVFTTLVEPQQFVDVVDIARLYVAALVNRDFKSERLFGCTRRQNRNDILTIMRKANSGKTFMEGLDPERRQALVY